MIGNRQPPRQFGSRWIAAMRRHRFDLLLAALVLLMLTAPLVRLLSPRWPPALAPLTVSAVFGLVLLSAVFAACQTRASVVLGLSLVLPAGLLQELGFYTGQIWLTAAGHVFSMAFLGFTVVVILQFLFTEKQVSFNVIWAAVCVYLLVGVLWANAYSLIYIVEPKSFLITSLADEGEVMRFGGRSSVYPIYYSFVTLSTLGYGDIVPVSSAARMFAVVEAIVGQLYLAVLIARLVGLHVSQSAGKTTPDYP